MPEPVQFVSGAGRCRGLVYPAVTTGPRPYVILCPGFGGTQDTPSLIAAAEAFARHGYHAMTFDYRHFGLSDGEPRQLVDLDGQLDDIRAAISFVRTRPDASGVVLWGTSLGGGHVVSVAATDPLVTAVIAQIPFNGFPRRVRGRTLRATMRLLLAMLTDRVRGWFSYPPRYIAAVGGEGELAVMAGEEAEQAVAAMASRTWRNEVAPRALFDMMRYRPGDVAPQLEMPVLVAVGEFDRETEQADAAPIADRAPHGVLRRYPLGHFDFYRPHDRERVLADQIRFLDEVTGRKVS
ncbi:alpha/beta hydrolase [Mycolicibacterium hippocampi]|uniref:alpha/beta hydrolase n=1 Tax=Mycolicibacterium hippocampi TaxID=659824 RepID=UPI003515855D